MVTDSENSASKVEDERGAATWAGLERAQLKELWPEVGDGVKG